MELQDDRENWGIAAGHPLLWVLGIIAASVFLGAVLGPAVFNAALRLGRHVPVLQWLRDVEFERVVSRVVTVSVVVLGLLTIRRSGLRGLPDVGYPRRPGWWRPVLRGLLVGVASMAVTVGLGFLMGAYSLRGGWAAALARKIVPTLVGALLIGLIEEGFFRGLIFGTLSRRAGFLSALVLSSLIFSLAHFLKPEPPCGVVYAHWWSGFALGAHVFGRLDMTWNSFPFSLNLFAMGAVLCVFCRRHGDVYFIAGLHAGWVWMLQAGRVCFARPNPEHLLWLFGPTDLVSKGYMALFMLIAFLAVAVLMRPKGEARA